MHRQTLAAFHQPFISLLPPHYTHILYSFGVCSAQQHSTAAHRTAPHRPICDPSSFVSRDIQSEMRRKVVHLKPGTSWPGSANYEYHGGESLQRCASREKGSERHVLFLFFSVGFASNSPSLRGGGCFWKCSIIYCLYLFLHCCFSHCAALHYTTLLNAGVWQQKRRSW